MKREKEKRNVRNKNCTKGSYFLLYHFRILNRVVIFKKEKTEKVKNIPQYQAKQEQQHF